MTRSLTLLGALTLPLAVGAHHSPNVHFDRGDVVEISGTLTSVEWKNPHTLLVVQTTGEDGSEVVWLGETKASTQLYRAGLEPDIFAIGDTVRMAGFRGRRNQHAMFVTNVLLADGSELIAENLAGPRWTENVAGTALADYQAQRIESSSASSSGLLKVWSRDGSASGADDTERMLWVDSYPLTAAARTVQENWDPVADNPYLNCAHGLPAIMDAIAPMEFVLEDPDILLRLEEQDVVRRIHMGSAPTGAVPSPYGHSVGHWEGETLVVTTTDIDWPWFDQSGVPQSEALRLVERFSVSEDGQHLDYSVEATDPAVFTETVLMEKRWTWIPGEEVKPYECSYERDDL